MITPFGEGTVLLLRRNWEGRGGGGQAVLNACRIVSMYLVLDSSISQRVKLKLKSKYNFSILNHFGPQINLHN